MELFEHPYYRQNRRLLMLIGNWPDLSKNKRRFRAWIVTTFLCSFCFVEMTLIMTSHGELQNLIDATPPLTTLIACLIKYYTVHFNMDRIKNLLNRVIENWNLWKSKEELDIMHKFGKESRVIVLWYTAYMYTAMTAFLLLPFVPRMMDLIVPLNESRPLKPVFRGEYFINEDEHFFSIYMHMSTATIVVMSVIVATDGLFLIFNSHICGVFAALGNYLENTFKDQYDSKSSLYCLSIRECQKSIAYSVEIHKKALEFAELLEDTYSTPLLQQVTLCLVCMSLSLFQILVTLEKPSEAFRYIAFATGQLIHLFCMCYPGQRMIDYSTQIQFQAYSLLWYKVPSKVSKLVLLIIRRSLNPCYLTAGKVFIFCLEGFSTIMQTSTSYFMVLTSFQ